MSDSSHANAPANGNGYLGDKLENISTQQHDPLSQIKSATSIQLSPELFEKLYLSPAGKVKGQLRQTLGNPTPLGVIGFVMCLGPLSIDLMGWRGAGGTGASSTPEYIFFGGMLMIIGGILEFILGNTFPSIVFASYSAWWLSFGGTLLPQFYAYAAYAPPDAASPAAGLETQGFNAGFGFFTLSMAMMSFVYFICSFRTNIAFLIVFLTLVPAFSLVTAAYWALASDYAGNAEHAATLIVAGGACAFITTAAGWWLFLSMMLASIDFPFSLPVGDLSTKIKGASERSAV